MHLPTGSPETNETLGERILSPLAALDEVQSHLALMGRSTGQLVNIDFTSDVMGLLLQSEQIVLKPA